MWRGKSCECLIGLGKNTLSKGEIIVSITFELAYTAQRMTGNFMSRHSNGTEDEARRLKRCLTVQKATVLFHTNE